MDPGHVALLSSYFGLETQEYSGSICYDCGGRLCQCHKIQYRKFSILYQKYKKVDK